MDAMQILVVILSIFLAVFLLLAIALTVMLIRVSRQINDIATSTKSTIDKVNSFASSAVQMASPAILAKLVTSQMDRIRKNKRNKGEK
jgi:predicted PurR-regulated permease PerM